MAIFLFPHGKEKLVQMKKWQRKVKCGKKATEVGERLTCSAAARFTHVS
jgi:hypothetical protein